MKPPAEITPWDRAAAARRTVLAARPPEEDLPPPGFSTRLAARWAELRKNEQFRLWSRWSLRAALGGLLTAGIMALLSAPSSSGGGMTAPEIELPSFSTR
ncbi:MAG TPA: hypothetical protein VHM91_22795 [Verrucomicrobiales bacterium]|jgi:hypothetical protein|nr:hypothetical protein [Verrucomicrobiales bacterium]